MQRELESEAKRHRIEQVEDNAAVFAPVEGDTDSFAGRALLDALDRLQGAAEFGAEFVQVDFGEEEGELGRAGFVVVKVARNFDSLNKRWPIRDTHINHFNIQLLIYLFSLNIGLRWKFWEKNLFFYFQRSEV